MSMISNNQQDILVKSCQRNLKKKVFCLKINKSFEK